MPELLSVTRPICSADHVALREQIRTINHTLPPDISLKWRRLGEVGLTLLERGEYQRALRKQQGSLQESDPSEVLLFAEQGIKDSKTESAMIHPRTTKVDFMGDGRVVDVAYFFDDPQLFTERNRHTTFVDRMNERNSGWREFVPHVSVASVLAHQQDEIVLQQFEAIRPAVIAFLPVEAKMT